MEKKENKNLITRVTRVIPIDPDFVKCDEEEHIKQRAADGGLYFLGREVRTNGVSYINPVSLFYESLDALLGDMGIKGSKESENLKVYHVYEYKGVRR
ncbi:hypothetical protein B6U80_00330 [Candidatus Pacearchaeota archaeon ex4484_26]|nr:MAG: hypothetical protein B6U80_00330 [Candidatus Pacearchaeota archaeon ex4484_26]